MTVPYDVTSSLIVAHRVLAVASTATPAIVTSMFSTLCCCPCSSKLPKISFLNILLPSTSSRCSAIERCDSAVVSMCVCVCVFASRLFVVLYCCCDRFSQYRRGSDLVGESVVDKGVGILCVRERHRSVEYFDSSEKSQSTGIDDILTSKLNLKQCFNTSFCFRDFFNRNRTDEKTKIYS